MSNIASIHQLIIEANVLLSDAIAAYDKAKNYGETEFSTLKKDLQVAIQNLSKHLVSLTGRLEAEGKTFLQELEKVI